MSWPDRVVEQQLRTPTGPLGMLFARRFARRNTQLNQLVIKQLKVQPSDHVLEVGFGPGVAIQLVSGLIPEGFVAGVDHSPLMVRVAKRRNRRAITQGRVELQTGSWHQLPYADDSFDRVFAVNTIYFWADLPAVTRDIEKVLKPDGTFAVGFRPVTPGSSRKSRTLNAPEYLRDPDETAEALSRNGFVVTGEIRETGRGGGTCITLRSSRKSDHESKGKTDG